MADTEKVLDSLDKLDSEELKEIVNLDGEDFELIGELEYDGQIYLALIPYKEVEDENQKPEFVVLREEENQNGDCFLATVDDTTLYQKIGNMFIDMFASP